MQPTTTSSSQERTRENASPLTKQEYLWRDRYGMLESHGYRLRQRYKPDWKPSWLTTKRPPPLHDDFKTNSNDVTIDATRIADGRRVFLKRLRASSSELKIHRFLLDGEKHRDPQNHTVPLLDEFPDDTDSSFAYIVMPLLRIYDMPEFFSVDEVIDFMRQLLEGLVYMHNLRVAHRDCSDLNIMMDADSIFPRGFHPKNLLADASGYKDARPKHRRDVPSVRYYFIDFGISSMFSPEEDDPRVIGLACQDKDLPELSVSKPYNPFYVDIFLLGNLFKKSFYEKYENLAFLDPLIDEMTQFTPRHRPKAENALRMFNTIISQQSPRSLKWRLKAKASGKVTRFLQDIDSVSYLGISLARNAICTTSGRLAEFLRRHIWPVRKS